MITNKRQEITDTGKNVRKGNYCVLFMEILRRLLKKLKIEPVRNLAMPLLGMYPKSLF